MTLYDANKLDGRAKAAWTDVTKDRIRGEAAEIFANSGEGLAVTIEIHGQDVSESRSLSSKRYREATTASPDVSIENETPSRHGGYLRGLRPTSLRISFVTIISFISEKGPIAREPNEAVASGFETQKQWEEYMEELRARPGDGSGAFEGVGRVSLEVDGRPVAVDAPAFEFSDAAARSENDGDGGGDGTAALYAVVAVVVSLCVLLACFAVCCTIRRGRSKGFVRHRNEGSDDASCAGSDNEDGDDNAVRDGGDEGGGDIDAVFDSITVAAPPGKLGLDIANMREDMPRIFAVKDGSVLCGRVQEGDLLLSVDEVDCRGMPAGEVSKLVGKRSDRPGRTLVLLREQ